MTDHALLVSVLVTMLVLPGFAVSEGTRAQYGVTVECDSNEHYVENEQYTYYLVTISNTGESEDTYNMTIDALPQHWQAELNASEITIPPGQQRNVMLKVKTTCECEFGERLILNVTATSQSDLGVFDRVQTITTYATVKVVLETQMDYRLLSRGGSYTHEISVRNEGSEEDTFQILASPSPVLTISMDEEYITLSTNTSGTVSMTVSASASAPYGYHELSIGAESLHNPDESEYITITVIVGEITLEIEDIELSPENPGEGETALISFKLSNTGTVAAEDLMITVHYLFKNGSKSEIGSHLVSIGPDDEVAVQRDIVYSSDFDGISVEAKIKGRYGIWEESLTPGELGFGEERDHGYPLMIVAMFLIALTAGIVILITIKNKRKKKV